MCTHQFVHPPISAADQAEMYDDSYFAAGGDWVCGLFGGTSYEDSIDDLVSESGEILRLIPASSGRLLDIGCAGGVFLNEARLSGFQVQGIEINASQAAAAKTRYGLDVLNSRIEEVSAAMGPYDVITLLDVLEHIPQPLSVLRRISEWQSPGAYLLIRGPMANSRLGRVKEAIRRVAGPDKRLPGYPLDANMFNLRSMRAMLAVANYAVVQVWAASDFANVLAQRAA